MFIKRSIRVPSLTLSKDDLNNLKLILAKTGKNPTFNIVTVTEEIDFNDFQDIANPNWPPNIERLSFNTGYSGRSIRGHIETSDIFGVNNITIEDTDRDWISSRVEELKRFLDQHHNLHYFFHDIKYLIAQGLFLVALLDYWLIIYFVEQDLKSYLFFPLLASFYGVWYLYGSLLPRIFPFLVLKPEHPSFTTKLRSLFKYLIPAIFVGLLIQLIWSLFPK